MIAFDLRCDQDHVFEAWFPDNDSFIRQKNENLISCPICGSTKIAKAISPVAVRTRRAHHDGARLEDAAQELLCRVTEYILQNSVDVGPSFAREALKMHYGLSESRNIRGVATEEEEEILKKEGINFLKIPVPKKPDPSVC